MLWPMEKPARVALATDHAGYTLKEAIKEYVWWDGSLSSDGLPSSKTVVHYHPIRFLAWINEKRESEAKGGAGAKLHESVYELNHLAS